MATKSIRELLGARPVHSVSPDTVLREVARLMAEHRVGAVVVMESGKMVGIVSERDIVFRGVGQGLASDTATAADVMTADPVTCTPVVSRFRPDGDPGLDEEADGFRVDLVTSSLPASVRATI